MIEFVNSFKKECAVCHESEQCCLDFHHIDKSDKEFNIAEKRGSLSKKAIEKEINKCVVLCANCHRKLHAGLITLSNDIIQ